MLKHHGNKGIGGVILSVIAFASNAHPAPIGSEQGTACLSRRSANSWSLDGRGVRAASWPSPDIARRSNIEADRARGDHGAVARGDGRLDAICTLI